MRSMSQTTSSGGFSRASRYLQELLVGGVEVLVLALVLPAEEAALPDVGPAVAAAALRGAPLEGEPLAVGVGLGGLGVAEQFAEVEEVLLGGGAFRQGDTGPLLDEFVNVHGRAEAGASLSWFAAR